MRYWCVNQNQTYKAEVRGSFMWSPKQNANGARVDGENGLLLSLRVDHLVHLFDVRGVSTSGVRVGELSREQNAYLDYRRVKRV